MRVQHLLDRLLESARRARFETRILTRKNDYELPVLIRAAAEVGDRAPTIYLSAGVHGDEPAGPLALLEMLRRRELRTDVNWALIPVVNPTGLAERQRENADGVDLNRDYGPTPRSEETRAHLRWLEGRRFDLAICLHEDFETDGAYLYELLAPTLPSQARQILDAMRPFTGIETRPQIDGMPNENGLMRPPAASRARDREDLPEAIRLHFDHAPACYTTETPSRQNIVQRIDAQRAAIEALTRAAVGGAFRTG